MSKFNDAVVKSAYVKKHGERPTESVDEFLARGGKITKLKPRGKQRFPVQQQAPKGVNAQALLDAAAGTPQEAEVIAFLEAQGFDVSE